MVEPDPVTAPERRETVTQESILLDHARRLEDSRDGRCAVAFRLSGLREHYREPYHIRIAARAFDAILQRHDARLYVLSEGDIVFIGRDIPGNELDPVVFKVRSLFRGDPMASSDDGLGGGKFIKRFDIERDYGAFLGHIKELVGARGGREVPVSAAASSAQAPHKRLPRGRPLDPELLDALCVATGNIGFHGLIDEQYAIRISVGGDGEVLFREQYVAIDRLGDRVAPGVDILSDKWLFQHLTETLDHRLLSHLGQENFEEMERAISINLNVASVLRSPFRAFDKAVGRNAGKVVIEFQQMNVFADVGAYMYVRDWLRARGYRVLIDGLNPLSLQFFDPALLAADYYKIYWGEGAAARVTARQSQQIRDLVSGIGRDRIIMARIDSQAGIEFGLGLGLVMFQGRYIDRLVDEMAESMGTAGFGNRKGL
ncbi:MAG: hypothetical protein OQJ99_08680 [Rhodospirillales bacterium]|nr:hypothetical protein [Rhodospirillales bacterium]MCW9002570.1 hypothetical protein [Rhodospirillales bacterium]